MASYFDYAQYDLLKNYPKKDKAIAKKIESLNDEILKKKRKLSLESIESWYKTKEAPKEYGLIEELKYLIEISKTNPASYKIIDNIQFQLKQFDPDLVVELMKTTLELNPLSPNNNFIDSAYNIIETRPLLRKEFDDCMAKISHMLGELDFKSLIFREKLQTKWILSDIEEMIKLIHAEGAVAVVQTYPPFRDGSPRSIDLILRKWWSEKEKVKNLKFLDVGEKLESKLSKKNGGDKYYATQFGPMDNHLNAAGYLEIAKLMLPYVQEEESSRP